jgi:hypothetical protein
MVEVTMANGSVQYVPIMENGTCSFSVRLGQEYSVQLPVFSTYFTPQVKTYIAMTAAREIYWSYVAMGIIGLDELGRKYSLAQIESLEDKSIIKYGGLLNNSLVDDTGKNCSVMWKINELLTTGYVWASSHVELDTSLLPYCTNITQAYSMIDGEKYTNFIIAEGQRLNISTPSSTFSRSQKISINGKAYLGFTPSPKQINVLIANLTNFNLLYNLLGLTPPTYSGSSAQIWTCLQGKTKEYATCCYNGNCFFGDFKKTSDSYGGRKTYTMTLFPLPL